MGLFRRKVETRQSQFIVPSEILRDQDYSNTTVTPETALRLSAVWACVRLLADSVSSLPLDAYRGDEEISLPPLLVSPSAGWSRTEFVYAAMVSLLLRGNAYGMITARSGPRLTPSQVELVNPDDLSVTVLQDGSVAYRYKGRLVDREDLWHVRAFPYPGSPVGLSPIAYAAETIGLGLATVRFGRAFFTQGAAPSGLLTMESTLSQEDADALKERLKRTQRGTRDPLIVSGDGVKWESMSIAPEESQFVESRRLGVAEIARTFGVPPELVGGESGGSLTYANVEQRASDFVRYSLTPWIVRLEDAIGTLLPRGQSVKFNVNALLRGTTLERYQAHEIALRAGFLSVDEVRALEDLPVLRQPASPSGARAPLTAVEGGAS